MRDAGAGEGARVRVRVRVRVKVRVRVRYRVSSQQAGWASERARVAARVTPL